MSKKIIILIILGVGFMYMGIVLKVYEKDYFGKLGLPRNFSYHNMIKIKGEPDEVREQPDGSITVHYEGLIIFFTKGRMFVRAEVVSNVYSFGRKEIKVGDSREKAERVCRWLTKIVDLPDNEIGYIEKNEGREVWVYYKFDQNNCISKIILTDGL